jgi:hypothetical protein
MATPVPPVDAPVSRGGLVFTVAIPDEPTRSFFLGADVAIKLAPRPQIARLPGAPPGLLGLALSEGAVVPLFELGPDRATMILCVHRGEPLGLVGAEDIQSGVFPADESGGVKVDGASVPPLDLEEMYARVHAVTWGTGWGG